MHVPLSCLLGTSVCGTFGYTMASTGLNMHSLRVMGYDMSNVEVVWIHPDNHVGYFPGGMPMHFKLIFDRLSGLILGAQAVGHHGVARRIDSVAVAIKARMTVRQISDLELCYAPQYGAAKDAVNLAGMVATNVIDEEIVVSDWARVIDAEVGRAVVSLRVMMFVLCCPLPAARRTILF